MSAQYSILVVDDDPFLAELLNRTARLSFKEAHFITFGLVEQALTYLESLQGIGPRLVMVNLGLQPEPGSLALLDILRQHHRWRLLPVILLSTQDDAVLFEQAYQLGANAITAKPTREEDWLAYLDQLRTYWFSVVTLPKLWLPGR